MSNQQTSNPKLMIQESEQFEHYQPMVPQGQDLLQLHEKPNQLEINPSRSNNMMELEHKQIQPIRSQNPNESELKRLMAFDEMDLNLNEENNTLQKIYLEPVKKRDNNHWERFVQAISAFEKPSNFLQILQKKVNFKGPFSQQVIALFEGNFSSKQIRKKICKNYQENILIPLVQPILNLAEVSLQGMKDEEKKDLFKFIGEGSEDDILIILESYIDTDDPQFARIIQGLLGLYQKPEQVNEEKQEQMTSKIEEKNENKIDYQTQMLMALINKQTQQFYNYLQENKVTLENQFLQQIMMIKFNNGRFSRLIDDYIRDLKELKKPAKKKVQDCFDDLFRDFDLSQQILITLQQLGFQGKDVKEIKYLIRKNDEQNISKKLIEYFEDEKGIPQFTKKLISERPQQLVEGNFSSRSLLRSISSSNSPKKQDPKQDEDFKKAEVKQKMLLKMFKQTQQKKKGGSQILPQKTLEKQKKIVDSIIKSKVIQQSERNQSIEKKAEAKDPQKKEQIKSKQLDQKRSREKELPEQKGNNNGKNQKFVQKVQQHDDSASIYKSKDGQPVLKLQHIDQKQGGWSSTDPVSRSRISNDKYSNKNSRQFESRNNRKGQINNEDFPTPQSAHGPNNTFPEFKSQVYNHEQRVSLHQQPDDVYHDIINDDSKFRQRSGQQMTSQSKGYSQSRFILIVKEKKTKFSINTVSNQGQGWSLNYKFVDRWDKGNLTAEIIRIDYDPWVIKYIISPQKQFLKQILEYISGKEEFNISRDDLMRNHLLVRYLAPQKSYGYYWTQIMTFYFMTVLHEYSKKRYVDNFWQTLVDLDKLIGLKTKDMQKCMSFIPNWYNTKKCLFSTECSRLMLYFTVTNISQSRNPLDLRNPYLNWICHVIQIDNHGHHIKFFNNKYTQVVQIKFIVNCILNKFKQNLTFNDTFFFQNFNIAFGLIQTFKEKVNFLKSMRDLLHEKFASIYPMIKDYIRLHNNNYLIFQFLVLRLTLINISKPSNHYNQYDLNQEKKRSWLIHTIREIKEFVLHSNQNVLKSQQDQLKKLYNYQTQIEEILIGKNSPKNYFLFNHESFFDFYSELVKIKEIKNFDLLKYFSKYFADNRKNKAIEHVIQKTPKSPNMISFMCSQDADSQRFLEQTIKKISTQINLLQIVKFWFEDDFKQQKHPFFTKIFLHMMEYSKVEEFIAYQFLKTIEPYYEKKQLSKDVELFERSVIQKMKRFCQFSDLQNHLLQIKDIRKPVRVFYLQELATRVQQVRSPLKKLQQVTSLIVSDRNIDVEDRDILLKKLFQNRNDKDKEMLKNEIIQYYSEGKKELMALGYYPNFSKTLQEIVKNFQDKDISYNIIQQMSRSKMRISTPNDREDFAKLGALVDNIFRQVQTLKKKNQNLIKVLRQYDDLFKEYIEELLQWNKDLPELPVKQSLANIRKFKEYLDYSVQINSLMKIPLWKKEEIKSLTDLLAMRKATIESYGQLIDSFEKQTLGFVQFKRYFKVDLLSTLLENINDRDENFKRKLTDFVSYLDEKTLKHYATAIQAVNKVSQDIEKHDFFDKKFKEIIDVLQNPSAAITIEEAYKLIKHVNDKFRQLQFDILNENEEILKTLIFKNKYKRVFEKITEKKIDPQTVLNDLKEYINDIQNSILKIQDIKELESVVLFQEWHKKAKTFKGFLEFLKKEVKAKKLQLSQNIFNVDSKLNQIDQMIDSSANRETSFKYDLQEILNYSVVKIKNENGFAHVEIKIGGTNKATEKQIMTPTRSPKKDQKDKQEVFTFKKLTQFKDKAILLVSDFEKSNQNLAIMQQTIDLLKQFLELYKILEGIEFVLEKAVIYGYNPADLQQKRMIKENNYDEIKKMKDEIQLIANEWIEGMKKFYEKSYLLTHFMGPRLNAFISDTLNFKFSPLIKQIIDLDEKQFAKQMDSLRYIGLERQNTTQIKKVQQICRIFNKLQAKTLQKFERRSVIEHDHIKNQIELITCNSVQNYYYALVKGNSRPEMNEILYLQKETSFEEIEVFIKRAIIKYHRTHYFIGVHYLPAEVQLKFIDLLNEYVRTQEKRKKFNKCKLCFIDNSPIEKVYLHLSKKQLFNAKPITDTHLKTSEETKSLFSIIGDTYLVESRIAGLGKTYWAEKKKPNSHAVYFSIAGHVHFSRLLQRLKEKKFAEDQPNTFIVQIGHVENKNKLQIFLFQLIFFKGFNFKQFFFLPKHTTVIIEIQNTYQTVDKYDYYSILKIIKEKKQKYVWIDKFKLEILEPNFSDIEEAFTFSYLIYIYQKTILKKEFPYEDFIKDWRGQNTRMCSKQDARKLIKVYFLNQLQKSNTQPTFWLYHSFIKLLFIAFKTFSQNGCFNIYALESNCRANRNLGLDNVRVDFLNCCIKNCIQFLQATINTNEFKQQEQRQTKITTQKDFRSSLSKFPFLIMPAYDFQNYQFVYLNSQDINISIKSLIVSQTIFKYIRSNKHGYLEADLKRRLNTQIVGDLFSEDALEHLKDDQLQREIYSILYILSGNEMFLVPDRMSIKEFKASHERIQNYSITLDNFFKMCLIIQRAVAHIPIIIMGESGVGKTALIKFLVEVVFQQRFLVFNIHAGVDQQILVKYYNQIKAISQELKNIPRQKVWVFFDQFNTSDQLSYMKEMVIDRKFQGERIPENVVLIGACNPYRKKKESVYKRAGIKKKVVAQKNQNSSDLAFKVKPPPLSMIQFMWDYQQLQLKQNLNYISKILQVLQLSNHQTVVRTIAEIHELFKNTYEISSVSLRDVTRFRELYIWFRNNMPRTKDNLQNSRRNPNYDLNDEMRAIALSMSFCYSLRIADRSQRKDLLKKMTEFLQFSIALQKIVQNEQIDYVQRLKISTQRIAINFSLRENVFTTLVCIMNKIPVLIIGNPGNSKSLSVRMISSNLRGLNSESQFCRKFPQLSIIYFQGSEACTSKGVEAVFQKAIKSNEDFKKKKQKQPGLGDVENCVLFDEIGLAQKSVHNPLKVLHSKLQTDQKQICFIGISNWQLDAAKMSRFLVLSRSNPEKEQLQDTAVKILESYSKRDTAKYEKTFKEMSDWYYDFVDKWDEENRNNQREGFFGLRDFYCYVKDVAAELESIEKSKSGSSSLNIDDIIRKAIKSNFDGHQDSVEMFLRISGLTEIQKQHIIDPIKLVEDNLKKDSSRCLLLIVRGDALIPIIHGKLKKNGQKRRIDCIYGSTFASDQQSEEYNLEITSIIISHMSRGTLLAFKNPNNSIQTSLYDVFNKSFTFSGPKKYCRVAVGANSNPKCVVHESFASVVFIDEDIVKNTDLAFLNRFQKHFLTLSNVISNFEKEFVHQITRWIESLLKFSKTTQYKKQEQYLINSSEESIVTLILRYRELFDTNKQTGIKKVKKALLKNATQHFYIALKDEKRNLIASALKAEVRQLLQEIDNQRNKNSMDMNQDFGFQDLIEEETVPKNKIIFTYDQNIYSSPTYMFCDEKTLKIRISEVKSERQLRKSLKDAFSSQKIGNIHILIDFQKEFYHLNFAAFLITGLKEEVKSNKTIYIIIKLSQSSLENAGRDHINISYLLDFEQRYIGSLTKAMSFLETIEKKTVKELYAEKRMDESFDNFYHEAIMRFRLIQNEKDILKGASSEEIKEFQFEQIMKMNENEMFRTEVKNFIYQNLSDAKIDISVILNNKEDRNLCSSPQESFDKYLQNCVIQTVCIFFDRAYRNGLFFAFDLPALFKFLGNHYDIKVLEIIYDHSEENYKIFLAHLVNMFIKDKSLHVNTYLKQYNSNPLVIKPMCLLPMGLIELSYISSSNQDSLFKTSSKILQLLKNKDTQAVQDCQISIQKCLSILNEKSVFFKVKKGPFDFEKFLNENQNLQIFYFFDMISKIFSQSIETIEIEAFPLAKIVYLFISIFKNLQIKQKILLLSLSKELWSNIFNLWILWITHNESQDYHREIEKHYLSNDVIKNQDNEAHKLPQLLKCLCQSTMSLQQQLLKLDIENFSRFGMQKYLTFFRKTYFYTQKIRLICLDLDVETSLSLKATKRFFDLMDEIYEREEIEHQMTIFLTNSEISFESKVQKYLHEVLLDEDRKQAERQHILSYLSLDIYGMWIERLNKSRQSQNVETETETCIQSFITYSNKYPSFANNSSFFLQNLFEDIIYEENTVSENIEAIEHEQSDMIKIINKNMSLDSNFAVALGNYFLENLKAKAQNEENEQVEGMNEGNNESFLKTYFEHFQRLIKRNSYQSKVFEVYATEFMKLYCLKYLEAVESNEDQPTTWKVDQLLREKSQIADTLRLYLLKNILYRNQKMTTVKDDYLENKRCKWLEHFRTLVCGKTFEILVPPPFQEQEKKLSELIARIRDEQYENMAIFELIIKESFESPITKYEFLTFMMNDVYTRSCSQDKIKQMSNIINNSEHYKDNTNAVQMRLLTCYFNHKISQVLKYDEREMETQQAKIQDFIKNQLVFVNYLNIFVACSTSQCPLIEMFFDIYGNVPEDYLDWIEKRFLVNGRENQSVSILKRFIELGDNTPGYYKCSNECDMFYTIGGSGGFGCQLPRVEGTCGWCKKTIGGTNHVLTRASEGARKVDLTELPKQLEIIREKKQLQVLNHKLNGYSYSDTLQQMKKQVISNKRLPQSAKYILQQMIFSVWSFLTSTSLIPDDTVKQLFHMNSRVFQVQSFEIMQQFYNMQTKSLNLNEQDQSDLVWHLGMSKEIMKFIIEYKTKLTNQMKQRMGLVRCAGRDMFEEYLVNNVVLKYSSGNQKLALVNKSRCVRAGINLSGQQILRQTGNYEQYLNQYPKIRLIKILYQDKSPSFDNMVEQYREKINRDYKILGYFIQHEEDIDKLRKYRTLYTFISKILKLFNLKVTRQQAKEKSLIKLYEDLYKTNNAQTSTSQFNSFREEVAEFCEVWNELREERFELRYGCHSFGFMNEVAVQLDPSSQAVNFFPDIKYKGHQKGEMILSLLQVTAQQYNDTCRQINHAKMGSQKYREIQIFNSKPINPTQIHTSTKTLELSRELIEDTYISNFSNWSIEYGCGLPHYSIDKIESLMVEHIVGCHNINEEIKEYDTINFIGEQLNFIVEIRDLQNQLDWEVIPRKQEIEKFIYNIKHDEPDSFLKEINSIKGSIELILHYFRLKKGVDIKDKTIEDFIRENKILLISKTLLDQPLLLNIEMKYILGFYEFVELHTLKSSVECLDESYKKEKLSQMEIRNLNMFLDELKRQYKAEEEINYNLSVAIYRFVTRSLLLVERSESLELFSFLYEGYDLWPNKFDIERLSMIHHFREAFSITLTKIQSLLEFIPFDVKKTKTEVILLDKKQTQQEAIKRAKEPQRITKTVPAKVGGKKKNL